MLARLFLLSFCLLLGVPALASSRSLLEKSPELSALALDLAILEDPKAQFTRLDIAQQSGWRPAIAADGKRGMWGGAVWLRLVLHAPLGERQALILEVKNPTLDRISFYPEKAEELLAGDRQTANSVLPLTLHPSFPLAMEGTQTVYLRLQTEGSFNFTLALSSRSEFDQNNTRQMMWLAIGFGFLLMMAAYNGLLALSTRKAVYLAYTCFDTAAAFSILGYTGLNRVLGGQTLVLWTSNEIMLTTVSLCCFFSCLLCLLFFDLKIQQRITKPLLFAMIVCLLNAILPFFHYLWSAKLMLLVIGLTTLSTFAVAARRLVQQPDRSVLLYVSSWVPLLYGAFAEVLAARSLIPEEFRLPYGPFLGMCLEAFMMSLAIGYKLRHELELNVTQNQLMASSLNEVSLALQQEIELRSLVVGDLSHRVNNPLHSAILGTENVRNGIKHHRKQVMSLFENIDANEPEQQTLKTHFQAFFEASEKDFQDIQQSLNKAARTVDEIHSISTVDGRTLAQCDVQGIFEEAVQRIQGHFGEGYATQVRIVHTPSKKGMVITNSLALKLAFEGILKAILRQGSPELSLQVSWVEREDGGGLLLLETNPSKDQWIERKLVEQAQTMLRPYGVKVQTDQQSVALEFPNINTILASPLASR